MMMMMMMIPYQLGTRAPNRIDKTIEVEVQVVAVEAVTKVSAHDDVAVAIAANEEDVVDGYTRILPSKSSDLLEYLKEHHSQYYCFCGSTRVDYVDRSNDNNSGDGIIFDNEDDEEQHQQHQQNKTKQKH